MNEIKSSQQFEQEISWEDIRGLTWALEEES